MNINKFMKAVLLFSCLVFGSNELAASSQGGEKKEVVVSAQKKIKSKYFFAKGMKNQKKKDKAQKMGRKTI